MVLPTGGRQNYFFSELFWGKGHWGLYKAPTKERRSKRNLRGERDQIKFIDLRFARWQVVRFMKARRRLDSMLSYFKHEYTLA